MPELPEVETQKLGLEPYLVGARLGDIHLFRPNLRYPFPEHFSKKLDGARVERLERRAKYILAHLDNQLIWVTHLGMTGRFHSVEPGSQGVTDNAYKHRHVSLIASKDDIVRRVDFFDPRRFGFMLLLRPDELYQTRWWLNLGVEPLSDDLNTDFLLKAFANRSQSLKALLMSQEIICGLGNIYVCEALFRSKLHPDLVGGELKKEQAHHLTAVIKDVLTQALVAGGATISDFASASGESGYFQNQFLVYGREGKPCLNKHCQGIIERKIHSGRSTFVCPSCQKAPKLLKT